MSFILLINWLLKTEAQVLWLRFFPSISPSSYRASVRQYHVRRNSSVLIQNCCSFQDLHQYKSSSKKKEQAEQHIIEKGQARHTSPCSCLGCNAVYTTACIHSEDEFHLPISSQNHRASQSVLRSLKESRYLSKDTSSLMFFISEQNPSASYYVNISLINTFLFCFTLQFTLLSWKNSYNKKLQETSGKVGMSLRS